MEMKMKTKMEGAVPVPKHSAAGIRKNLRALRLLQIEKHLDEELTLALKEKTPPTEFLGRLLNIEVSSLRERRIARRIKESRLPEHKLIQDFDFEFQKGIDKRQILELSALAFVERRQGLVLAGNSGVGKSHLAKALLLLGCQKDLRCRYTTAADMLKDLLAGLADGSVAQKLKQYTQVDILLIDEVGFDRLEQESARNASLFFKVIDARYDKASTWLTTNVDFKDLGAYLGDPVITTAIVDRLVHHSIIIHVEGPSYRMHQSKKLNREAKSKNGSSATASAQPS
jgi:DNA replication protein DnaC